MNNSNNLTEVKKIELLFDKQDNCFQISEYRRLEVLTGERKSSIGRLFQLLRTKNLLKSVVDIQGNNSLMIAPYLYCSGNWIEKRFMMAMFILGTHKSACEWSKACLADSTLYRCENFNTFELIDIKTGEVLRPRMKPIRELSVFEVEQWKCYQSSYSKFDRTKPRYVKVTTLFKAQSNQ